MTIWESMRWAYREIRDNQARAILTTLGLIAGVASVIILLCLTRAVEDVYTAQVGSTGESTITLTDDTSDGSLLDIALADDILGRSPALDTAFPTITLPNAPIKLGRLVDSVQVDATSELYPAVKGSNVRSGSFFTSADVQAARRVAVVGQRIVEQMFRGKDPLGQEIRIYEQGFKIIGILEPQGNFVGQDLDKRVVIPVTSAQSILGTGSLSAIHFLAASPELVPQAIQEISQALQTRFADTPGAANLHLATAEDLRSSLNDKTFDVRVMLIGIAVASLFAGGIGVMNTMQVLGSERSGEIALRKALGAKQRDIRLPLMMEAVLLGTIGGCLGAAIGALGAGQVAEWPTLSPGYILLGLTLALLISVAFAAVPAYRASRLNPTLLPGRNIES